MKIMSKKKYLQLLLLAAVMFNTSCTGNFDELNDNPNATTQVPPSMIVTNMLSFMKPGDQRGDLGMEHLFAKYMSWVENMKDIQYNRIDEKGFGVYPGLSNIEKMIGYTDESSYDPYMGLGLFVKTFHLFQLSAYVGDIPYSEALQGETGLLTPKYDTQKEVMRQIIAEQDAAYNHFNKATISLGGDFTDFNGEPDKWKRIVNLAELRVLINLSKKESDPDLNIKAKFAEVASRPLLESNDDNLKLTFRNASGMWSPWYVQNGFYLEYQLLSDFFIDMMKKYDDYRLFYYAEPAKYEIETNGRSADDWEAYAGADPTLQYADLTPIAADGKASGMNLRYKDPVGEPWSRLGYTQQCFILAEGALRGWLPGKTAEEYYKKGIEAGMKFTRDATALLNNPDFYHGREMTDAYIAAHLNYPALQLTGDFESDLQKILEQKYIAGFMQYLTDQYFDYRRTGYPVLPINPSTNMNTMTDRLPVRYLYPQKERTTNLTNLEEAINRQYPRGDNVNELMWLLK
jgi:hypothetical protein